MQWRFPDKENTEFLGTDAPDFADNCRIHVAPSHCLFLYLRIFYSQSVIFDSSDLRKSSRA